MRRSKNPEILAQLGPARQRDQPLPSILPWLIRDKSRGRITGPLQAFSTARFSCGGSWGSFLVPLDATPPLARYRAMPHRHRQLIVVMRRIAPRRFDRSLNRPMRKATLLEKAHALCTCFRTFRRFRIFAAQHFARTLRLALCKFKLRVTQRFAADAMTFQFGQNAIIAIATGTPMHQRFGKTFLREEFGFLKPVEQGIDIVVILRVRG